MANWDPQVNEVFVNALEQAEGSERVAFLDKMSAPAILGNLPR
jgi:hypothetical protein